jgi:hypothetical protein
LAHPPTALPAMIVHRKPRVKRQTANFITGKTANLVPPPAEPDAPQVPDTVVPLRPSFPPDTDPALQVLRRRGYGPGGRMLPGLACYYCRQLGRAERLEKLQKL